MNFKTMMIEDLNDEEQDLLIHIYVGQNIRSEGILEKDTGVRAKKKIFESLIDNEFVERWKYYRLSVLSVFVVGTSIAQSILRKRLRKKKNALFKQIQEFPKGFLSFFTYEYLSEGLSFSFEEEWLFNWKEIVISNNEIKDRTIQFFEILKDNGLCVKTKNYVSTRGGETRSEAYTISAEVREFLTNIISYIQIPIECISLATIHNEINNELFSEKNWVEFTIEEEDLGTRNISIRKALDSFLERIRQQQESIEVHRTPDSGIAFSAKRKDLVQFLEQDVKEHIIDPILSLVEISEIKKEEEKIDFLSLIRILVEKKYSLFSTVAQFEGRSIFKTSPYTEKIVLNLITPSVGVEGLSTFIIDLHQFLEESSDSEVLKFLKRNPHHFEDWLGLNENIFSNTKSYEDAKSFFYDLNRLRNYYSHLADAKHIFQAGKIFNNLISKFQPEDSDVDQMKKILLERSIRSLEGLEKTLRTTRQKSLNNK